MVAVTLMWSTAGVVTRHLESARSFEVTFWRSAFTVLSLGLILRYKRGANGKPFHFLDFALGEGYAITNALAGLAASAFTALQQQGVESKLLVFPDENHWILKPRNSIQWHQTVFKWVGKYLKD